MSSNGHTTRAVDLGRDPIGPLLCRLALPTITAQVVNLLYNIVDRIYIGRIPLEGKLALTGMGVTFPVITLISAFSALVGMGGAPRASIALGAGEKDRAERTLGTCATALWGIAAAVAVVIGLFVCADLLRKPYCYIDGVAVYDKEVALQTTVYLESFSAFEESGRMVDELIRNN